MTEHTIQQVRNGTLGVVNLCRKTANPVFCRFVQVCLNGKTHEPFCIPLQYIHSRLGRHQVEQLSRTARYIAPAVYVFTKRVMNVISQLEKELRRNVRVACRG